MNVLILLHYIMRIYKVAVIGDVSFDPVIHKPFWSRNVPEDITHVERVRKRKERKGKESEKERG